MLIVGGLSVHWCIRVARSGPGWGGGEGFIVVVITSASDGGRGTDNTSDFQMRASILLYEINRQLFWSWLTFD